MSDNEQMPEGGHQAGRYILNNGLGRAVFEAFCNTLRRNFGLPDHPSDDQPIAILTFRDACLQIPDEGNAQQQLQDTFDGICKAVSSMTAVPGPRGGAMPPPSSVAGSRGSNSRSTTTASTVTTARRPTPSVASTTGSSASAGGNSAAEGGLQPPGTKRSLEDPTESRHDRKTLQVRLSALHDATIAREFDQITSVEGRVFSPIMLELSKFAERTEHAANQLMRSLLSLDGAAPVPSVADILSAPLGPKIAANMPSDDQSDVRDHIAPLISKLHGAALNMNRIMARAHKLFWIANHTEHGNWTVVSQILTRERWDEEQLVFDKNHKALVTWPEKQAAALAACGYTKAVDKNGALVGPISPDARKLVGSNKGSSRDPGSSFRSEGKGGSSNGAARNKGKGQQPSRGKSKATKRHSHARKQDAGSGAPAAPAAAAASPAP